MKAPIYLSLALAALAYASGNAMSPAAVAKMEREIKQQIETAKKAAPSSSESILNDQLYTNLMDQINTNAAFINAPELKTKLINTRAQVFETRAKDKEDELLTEKNRAYDRKLDADTKKAAAIDKKDTTPDINDIVDYATKNFAKNVIAQSDATLQKSATDAIMTAVENMIKAWISKHANEYGKLLTFIHSISSTIGDVIKDVHNTIVANPFADATVTDKLKTAHNTFHTLMTNYYTTTFNNQLDAGIKLVQQLIEAIDFNTKNVNKLSLAKALAESSMIDINKETMYSPTQAALVILGHTLMDLLHQFDYNLRVKLSFSNNLTANVLNGNVKREAVTKPGSFSAILWPLVQTNVQMFYDHLNMVNTRITAIVDELLKNKAIYSIDPTSKAFFQSLLVTYGNAWFQFVGINMTLQDIDNIKDMKSAETTFRKLYNDLLK